MRSEAEIRREIEGRLRRRAFLLLHGALWAIITFSLFIYARNWGIPPGMESMPVGWTTSAAFFMGLWACIVGLHAFWVIYVELRERLVWQAIERERRYYDLGDSYAKPKRREIPPRQSDDESIEDAFVDFPDTSDNHESRAQAKVKHGR
jgi:hypothetical protein